MRIFAPMSQNAASLPKGIASHTVEPLYHKGKSYFFPFGNRNAIAA
jgi:hypothetical protein